MTIVFGVDTQHLKNNNDKFVAQYGHDMSYFEQRKIYLDLRGSVSISPKTYFGFNSFIYSMTHDFKESSFDVHMKKASVIIEDDVWITSNCVLVDCLIHSNVIVSAGTVVSGQVVGPDVIVAGNPARVVAKWNNHRWNYIVKEFNYLRGVT